MIPTALPLTRDAPEKVLAVVRAQVPRLYGRKLSRGYLIRDMGEASLLTGQARAYYCPVQMDSTVRNRTTASPKLDS